MDLEEAKKILGHMMASRRQAELSVDQPTHQNGIETGKACHDDRPWLILKDDIVLPGKRKGEHATDPTD